MGTSGFWTRTSRLLQFIVKKNLKKNNFGRDRTWTRIARSAAKRFTNCAIEQLLIKFHFCRLICYATAYHHMSKARQIQGYWPWPMRSKAFIDLYMSAQLHSNMWKWIWSPKITQTLSKPRPTKDLDIKKNFFFWKKVQKTNFLQHKKIFFEIFFFLNLV